MKIFLTSILLVMCTMLRADVYTFETAGNWNDASNWDTYPGTTIGVDDEIIVNDDITINVGLTLNGTMTVSENVTMTIDWVITVNGEVTIDGNVLNSTQINLFGDIVCNGSWDNVFDTNASIIVTGTGNFSSHGDFINGGSVLGYFNSYMLIEGNFENNDAITFNGQIDINQTSGKEFANNGWTQFNGDIRLEGKLVNQTGYDFNINWSSKLVLSDNSMIENFGTLKVDGELEMSSNINSNSVLGHVKVDGVMTVMTSIVEVL